MQWSLVAGGALDPPLQGGLLAAGVLGLGLHPRVSWLASLTSRCATALTLFARVRGRLLMGWSVCGSAMVVRPVGVDEGRPWVVVPDDTLATYSEGAGG
jgi:hypothetical protein